MRTNRAEAFRQRIGVHGVELMLQESIRVNDPPDDSNLNIVISVDTTVQKKTLPIRPMINSTKNHQKMLDNC